MISLLVVVGGFASGVALRSFFVFGWAAISFFGLMGLLLFCSWLFAKRKGYLVGTLFLLAAVFGIARFHLAEAPLPEAFLADLYTRVAYEGRVVREPDLRDATQRVTVEVVRGDEVVRVLVIAERYPVISYGDTVRVRGELVLPKPFDTDAGRVFRYDKYLEKDRIRFLVQFAAIEPLSHQESFSLRRGLYKLKSAFNAALARALPEPSASLASGLILGGKQGLGHDLQETFITVGLIHIVVLSGYNVMIVAEA